MLPSPPVYAEYLTDAVYDLRHTGELEGGLIDHPECHPYDKYPLGNRLIVNGGLEPYGSFFVVPGVPVLPKCVSAAGIARR